ncbi:MAG: DUF1294 domain-containing protein [Fusobacteriaceae bacterium]|jgi:uncharacterized membrane protein YsdA (DUF1294 family)|nr:DUF1294 domain-containing protein [Fusobacteriaceae bacterium]
MNLLVSDTISYIRNIKYLKFFAIYLLFINFWGYLSIYRNKIRIKKNKEEIKIKKLYFYVLLLGGIGILLGMYHFRQEIKKWYFTYTVPFLLFLQFIFFGWLYIKF